MSVEKFNYPIYRNQIVYQIEKKKEVNEVWSSFCKEDLFAASKCLTKSALQLYLYFLSNQDGYTFALGREPVKNVFGFSDKTYQRAVDSLIEHGYLYYNGEEICGSNDVISKKWYFNPKGQK